MTRFIEVELTVLSQCFMTARFWLLREKQTFLIWTP